MPRPMAHDNAANQTTQKRLAYTSPRLCVYGHFAKLTAAGSAVVGENEKSRNRNRRL